jgi:uncharacterized lipoprotein YajG
MVVKIKTNKMQNKIKNGLLLAIVLMTAIMLFTSCGSKTTQPETTPRVDVKVDSCNVDSCNVIILQEDSCK